MAPFLPEVARLYRTAPQTDAELLEQFTTRRDEAAFAALVQRHGPMVLGVCKRLLRDHGDAEDAFQATFLVLARKAVSLAGQTSLAPWLHGVAQRTALRARSLALKRTARHEPLAAEPVAPPMKDADAWEWQQLLEEELGRLPEKYRLPLVLHYLTGQTKAETAAHLGVPEGTISSRLARGRESLQQRLLRRGVALTGAAIVPLLLPRPVAARLAKSTATLGGSGLAISPTVSTLTQGVLRAMFFDQCRRGFLLLLVLIICGLGWGLLPSSAADPMTAAPRMNSLAIPVMAGSHPNQPQDFAHWWLLFQGEKGERIAIRADGKVRHAFPAAPKSPTETYISPDGKWKAEVVWDGQINDLSISRTEPVVVADGNRRQGTFFMPGGPAVPKKFVGWSPTSKRLAFTCTVDGKPQIYVVDVAEHKVQMIKDGELGNIQPWFSRYDTIAYLALRERQGAQMIADLQITYNLHGSHTVVSRQPIVSYAIDPDYLRIACATTAGLYLSEKPQVIGGLRLEDARHVTVKSINPQWQAATFDNLHWRPDSKAMLFFPVSLNQRGAAGEENVVILPLGGAPYYFPRPSGARFVKWLQSEKEPTAEQFAQ
jgi:RNA polymerase sigma factor (sigma-70 family)